MLNWLRREDFPSEATPGLFGDEKTVSDFDQNFLMVIVILICFGAMAVYTGSIALPENPKFRARNWSELTFFYRHLTWVAIGLFSALVAFQVPMRAWRNMSTWLLLLGLTMLVLALWVGDDLKGASRWLRIGPLSTQPSEALKIAMVLYAAAYMVRCSERQQKALQAFWPIATVVLLASVLLAQQPDLGAMAMIVAIATSVLFLGGLSLWLCIVILVSAGVAGALMILFAPWRLGRWQAYIDPWAPENAQAAGYQVRMSVESIAQGGWFGNGWGGSIDKLHYLPDAHTDFIFAVLAAEVGWIGIALMLGAMYWVINRSFSIGRTAVALGQTFSGLTALGVACWFALQTALHVAVNLGLLPTKGLTLPLFSYGGSSLLISCVALAIVLRVDYENRILSFGGQV